MSNLLINTKKILIGGEASTGKTFSLKALRNNPRVLYINFEGKGFPFPMKDPEVYTDENGNVRYKHFKNPNIAEKLQAFGDGKQRIIREENTITQYFPRTPEEFEKYIKKIVDDPVTFASKYDLIIIDSFSSQQARYISYYEPNGGEEKGKKGNSLQFWQQYNAYFTDLIQIKYTLIPIPILILGHNVLTEVEHDNGKAVTYAVECNAGLKRKGVENMFDFVVHTKVMPVAELENLKNHNNAYLNITDDERRIGVKNVYKVRGTTPLEKIRSPQYFFEPGVIYTDNDISIILQHLKDFDGE